MQKKNAKNILVVKNRAMGDSVMGLSTLEYFRSLYPNSKIYYGLPAWITKLYKNSKIEADGLVNVDLKGLGDWKRLWSELRSLKIDLIYEMHQAGRTAKFFNLYSFLTRTPYHFHNHHLKSGGPVHDQGVIKSLIQRDLDGPFSFYGDKNQYPNYLDLIPKISPKTGEWKKDDYILFGVVATRETKMWPFSYYVELAKELSNTKIKIPLSKSKVDLEIKSKLIELGLPSNAEIVHIDLEDLPEFISKARLYIGNDTGLKHLAIATGVKSYTFFGPEPPNEWHPYNKEEHPYFYKEGLECRTRNAHYCGLSTCDSMICLNEFKSKDIFEIIKRDLDEYK